MPTRVPVTLPTLFKSFTGGVGLVEVEAETVGEMLDAIIALYPQLKDRIYGADGSQQRFLNVFVNGLDVRFIDGMNSTLTCGDQVQLVPAIAGGV